MEVGDIRKWRGLRNSDTGEIDGGYLYIITEIKGEEITSIGKHIRGVRNRSEAIKKYNQQRSAEL